MKGRRRWWILAVVLLVPLLELAAFIAVGRLIGGWPTFFLFLAETALGAYLVRKEGRKTWRALREALSSGRMPSVELADAALVFVGGVLLLLPGFLTDIVGMIVLLPWTRPWSRRLMERVLRGRFVVTTMTPMGPMQSGPIRPGAPHGSADSAPPHWGSAAGSGPQQHTDGQQQKDRSHPQAGGTGPIVVSEVVDPQVKKPNSGEHSG